MMKKLRLATSPNTTDTDSETDTPRTPSGFLAVYVRSKRERFLILIRYLNLLVFVTLLKRAEEEYGFKFSGGIMVLCEVGFFRKVLEFLEKDERKFGRLELDEFLKMFSEVGFDRFSHLKHNAS